MRLGGIDNSAVDHPLLGPGTVTGVRELGPFPDAQVAQTIGVMRARVREDRTDPQFQAHAKRVMGSIADPVTGAFEHTRRSIAFVHDKELASPLANPDNVVEFTIRPKEMAKLIDRGSAAGDCEDFCMYAACLLECYGIPTSFVTVAADPSEPQQYSHVYLRCYPYRGGRSGSYVALDASHGQYCGWEVPNMLGKLREWPVEDAWVWLAMTAELAAAAAFIGFVVWAIWK